MACLLVRSVFLLSCLMAIEVCLARSLTDEQVVSNPAEKVPVSLYYESLCPGCQEFVLAGLAPMFLDAFIDIVDLRLVPWGNAILYPNMSFVCQHGPPECFLNTVEACAIDAWPTPNVHFPFIYCVERLAYMGKHTEWETCFTRSHLDPKPVKDCSSGQLGTKLEQQYGNETRALSPHLEFVPWVVVNGQPIKDDIENLRTYICKAYKGTPPSVCRGHSSLSSLTQQTPHVHPVCYATQEHNSAAAAASCPP
ncbi:hypothetical protein RND81_01G120000 [Saponaria officinalis]|uniref:Gamma-interferon-inducible lysosomal thiol reductase n=1 Tax=Saponaria officinalis TaxID=3572 RepID=A0AAW1N773_SAPOF